jgi:hypothetical protein
MLPVMMELSTLAVMVVALSAALAHALELPGKMRLTKDEYFVVQAIYYPGFTIAGGTEPLATVLLLILVVLSPHDGKTWLFQVALLAWIAMQVVYWLVTHRLNRVWLRGTELSASGSRFFSLGQRGSEPAAEDWTRLRDRWEYSHVVRAILASVSFLAVAVAITLE